MAGVLALAGVGVVAWARHPSATRADGTTITASSELAREPAGGTGPSGPACDAVATARSLATADDPTSFAARLRSAPDADTYRAVALAQVDGIATRLAPVVDVLDRPGSSAPPDAAPGARRALADAADTIRDAPAAAIEPFLAAVGAGLARATEAEELVLRIACPDEP
jgi:hypothetical protein